MKTESALSKRIRRHVTGRIREFFASAAPGLEKLCFGELISLPGSITDVQAVPGGVAFKARVHDAYLANLHLRTASRILMRIGAFTASSFSQLEHCLEDFPWELYLHPGDMPEFHITAAHSRLFHTGAIAERFAKNITERMKEIFPLSHAENTESLSPQIFIRVADDRFTISLDSSGEHLHKRGIRKLGGDAPIRETTASAVLRLAGYDAQEPLIDPMCGTGTFSLEAAMLATRTPPGFFRNFAFMHWPCFQPGRWAHIRREAEKQISFPDKAPLIFASDAEEKACEDLKKNISGTPFSPLIQTQRRDFFDLSPAEFTDQKGMVVINPPYGLRLGSPEKSAELFQAVCRHLAETYKEWKFALIAADPKLIRNLPFSFRKHPLFHGGLNLHLLAGKIL
ncbi:MAG: hypothetical protein R2941_22020 [Desulfobacterales bacterium]